MGKKIHATLDPVRNTRYKRRHPEETQILPKHANVGQERERFLDRRFAGR